MTKISVQYLLDNSTIRITKYFFIYMKTPTENSIYKLYCITKYNTDEQKWISHTQNG